MNYEISSNDDFRKCFEKLPERIKRTARKNYKIWKENQSHPGLDYKSVGNKLPVYSVRVSIGWRASLGKLHVTRPSLVTIPTRKEEQCCIQYTKARGHVVSMLFAHLTHTNSRWLMVKWYEWNL